MEKVTHCRPGSLAAAVRLRRCPRLSLAGSGTASGYTVQGTPTKAPGHFVQISGGKTSRKGSQSRATLASVRIYSLGSRVYDLINCETCIRERREHEQLG